AFAAKHYDTVGALMFTASHNPPEYCGIKFIPEYAGPATPEITDALLHKIADVTGQIAREGHMRLDPGNRVERFDPYDAYMEGLSGIIDYNVLKQKPLKILYDPMFGAGQGFLDRMFRETAGYDIEVIHNWRDPLFGGRIPEP